MSYNEFTDRISNFKICQSELSLTLDINLLTAPYSLIFISSIQSLLIFYRNGFKDLTALCFSFRISCSKLGLKIMHIVHTCSFLLFLARHLWRVLLIFRSILFIFFCILLHYMEQLPKLTGSIFVFIFPPANS